MRRTGVPTGGQLHGPVPGATGHLPAAAAAPGGDCHAASIQISPVPSTVRRSTLRLHR